MDLYQDSWSSYNGGIYRHRTGNYLKTNSIAIGGYDADGVTLRKGLSQ